MYKKYQGKYIYMDTIAKIICTSKGEVVWDRKYNKEKEFNDIVKKVRDDKKNIEEGSIGIQKLESTSKSWTTVFLKSKHAPKEKTKT